ncbi:MAG: histidine kinase [Flavobacteriales bacterium]|nr:histidine kinase [Flavobacteriales bacterium]
MNPHFTFNALNSIQSLIASDKNDEAAIYLAEFSELMRNALEASSIDTHPLHNELEIVKQYLELEKLRFKKMITFEINIGESVHTNSTFIPPMIIRPLVENAILHGLLPKKQAGEIRINVQMTNEQELEITVEDNGVGKRQSSNKNKPASKGLKLIDERLKLNNKTNSIIVTSPVKDKAGFRATIKIYLK